MIKEYIMTAKSELSIRPNVLVISPKLRPKEQEQIKEVVEEVLTPVARHTKVTELVRIEETGMYTLYEYTELEELPEDSINQLKST